VGIREDQSRRRKMILELAPGLLDRLPERLGAEGREIGM
jgi:hypothetical protein